MNSKEIKILEKTIDQLFTDWHVAGGAVSIVKDGEVLSSRGYGIKEIGKNDPVDADTIFGIGSNTKSFTAAGVALLVDEGKLDWDDPVIKHLPDFKLSDPWITEHITLRDMLSHRSGLGRAMRPLYNRNYDLDEVIRRMQYMDFISEFRDDFGYNNYHFMVAGKVIEAVSGQTWPEFIREKFFKPLGMNASSADRKQMEGQTNISGAHANLDERLLPHYARLFAEEEVVDWDDVGNQPAGGINSSANDMTRWIKMLLAGGTYEGKQYLSQKVIQDMSSACAAMKNPGNSALGFLAAMNPEINFYTYGLGWFVIDYKGRKIYFHGGQITGFNSIVALFPQENLGYSILTNSHQTVLHAVLMFVIADAFLGGSQTEWSQGLMNIMQYANQQEEEAARQKMEARQADQQPDLAPESYCGIFRNDFMGDTSVELKDGSLYMQYGTDFKGKLQHWQANTFYASWENKTFDWDFVEFKLENGQVNGLTVENEGFYQKI